MGPSKRKPVGDEKEETKVLNGNSSEFPSQMEVKEESDVGSETGSDSDDPSSSELDDSDDVSSVEGDGPSTSLRGPDYEDTSDEEDLRNTIGNIPVRWYEDEEHVGYDLDGKTIAKPPTRSDIDEFLARSDDPDYWRKVRDQLTGEEIRLTDEQIATIKKMQSHRFPQVGYNPYQPYVDFFTNEVMEHPVTNHPPQKREFIPSKLDKDKVSKMVYAIKMGWMKPRKPKVREEEPQFFDIWDQKDEGNKSKSELARIKMHIPAPKTKLPGHSESYRPPKEYLFTPEEEAKWKDTEPEDRRLDFIPQRHDSLRQVPAYPTFLQERFQRCLDLYLAPRKMKMKLNVDPKELLPDLPKPSDLRPFPVLEGLQYQGHTAPVRSLAMEMSLGQWFASGGEDCSLRIWEVLTGRCMTSLEFPEAVVSVAWNPNSKLCLAAIATGNMVILLNLAVGDKRVITDTDNFLKGLVKTLEAPEDGSPAKWEKYSLTSGKKTAVSITMPHKVGSVVWHRGGDYLGSLCPDGGAAGSVLIHQLSSHKSQSPFSKSKGEVRAILFHPTQPLFFVATQRHIRVYNLAKQQLLKKLLPNCHSVSTMAIHPKGDNLLVGSHDCKITWFDMDLSAKPYKTLRYQKGAIRGISFHQRYPLFATASDDTTTLVSHGRVFSDLVQNPVIVPVKVLRGHGKTKSGLGVLACAFHPTQPWLVSAGADHSIRLFTE